MPLQLWYRVARGANFWKAGRNVTHLISHESMENIRKIYRKFLLKQVTARGGTSVRELRFNTFLSLMRYAVLELV